MMSHPRLSGFGDDVERFLQSGTVKIHERLHQVLGGGPHRRIGDRFYFLDQPADPLHVFPKISVVGHKAPSEPAKYTLQRRSSLRLHHNCKTLRVTSPNPKKGSESAVLRCQVASCERIWRFLTATTLTPQPTMRASFRVEDRTSGNGASPAPCRSPDTCARRRASTDQSSLPRA